MQGTAVVASNQYLPLSILELCNRYSCTVLPGIPMIFDHLAQTPRNDGIFRTVRTFISAGAPLPANVSRHFRERFGIDIHTFYGCSECGGITYDRDGGAVERGRIGFPMDGVSLTLQKDGRLLVKSDSVASGYLGGSAEEATRFVRGMFTTDDLAAITESGEVELVGRIGDLINTAGKKVNPREIERVILQIKGIQQVKVYGEPAGARGEVVAAAVVADPNVSREEIRLYCREHLSTHKVPRIVKLIASIPVDERGKFKRSALALL
jgi:long-chain acyl-CoA synthetase